MSAPRLEIDLDKIGHNARTLVDRLAAVGIAVTGVTKATLGAPEVAGALLRSGVAGLGDARVENLERLRHAGVAAPTVLIRSPMPSDADRVVRHADLSANTELEVLSRLSDAAGRRGRVHQVLLMVELGDLREGILPGDLIAFVREMTRFPHVALAGIGTNLACQHGVVPDTTNMAELTALAEHVEAATGRPLAVVSGGNSANLAWALSGGDVGRVNDLRLGESILLGREPLHRTPIEGLHTDAFRLVAEVIESKRKPGRPWGDAGQSAYGTVPAPRVADEICQTIVALGRQDVDPDGLRPPTGTTVLGCSSDHLVLDAGRTLRPGAEIGFGVDYSALVRAMTSPFVAKVFAQATAV